MTRKIPIIALILFSLVSTAQPNLNLGLGNNGYLPEIGYATRHFEYNAGLTMPLTNHEKIDIIYSACILKKIFFSKEQKERDFLIAIGGGVDCVMLNDWTKYETVPTWMPNARVEIGYDQGHGRPTVFAKYSNGFCYGASFRMFLYR